MKNNIFGSYRRIPYHNQVHACDVSSTLFNYIERNAGLRHSDWGFELIEIYAMLISAAGHDINHPGTNNMYEVATRSQLSLVYNDRSVLENYHIYIFYNLMSMPELNACGRLQAEELKKLRQCIVSNILATDITNHKANIDKLELAIQQSIISDSNACSLSATRRKLGKLNSNRLLLSGELLHLADVSNPTKKFDIYNQWVDRIFQEFFQHGDKEKDLGLPISMLCDRATTNIPSSQVHFIKFFVFDLLILLKGIIPEFESLHNQAKDNLKIWENKI